MTSEKYIALIEKLIIKTKFGEIKWKRYTPNAAWENWASGLKSFFCFAGRMRINMLSDENFDRIQFEIQYDPSLPSVLWSPESDEEQQVSLRLANCVYNQFPNLENSIDDFLNNF